MKNINIDLHQLFVLSAIKAGCKNKQGITYYLSKSTHLSWPTNCIYEVLKFLVKNKLIKSSAVQKGASAIQYTITPTGDEMVTCHLQSFQKINNDLGIKNTPKQTSTQNLLNPDEKQAIRDYFGDGDMPIILPNEYPLVK